MLLIFKKISRGGARTHPFFWKEGPPDLSSTFPYKSAPFTIPKNMASLLLPGITLFYYLHAWLKKRTTYNFQTLCFFLSKLGSFLEARIISVHLTASCSSMNLSLYWFLSIRTRAISTRVNRFLCAMGTSSWKIKTFLLINFAKTFTKGSRPDLKKRV